jgi:hypothetical protein
VVAPDRDRDELPDRWERAHGLSARDPHDAAEDPDEDGLANWQEHAAGAEPQSEDGDDDDYADTVEVKGGSDPSSQRSVPRVLHGDPSAEVPRLGGGFPWWAALLAGAAALAVALGLIASRRTRHID